MARVSMTKGQEFASLRIDIGGTKKIEAAGTRKPGSELWRGAHSASNTRGDAY